MRLALPWILLALVGCPAEPSRFGVEDAVADTGADDGGARADSGPRPIDQGPPDAAIDVDAGGAGDAGADRMDGGVALQATCASECVRLGACSVDLCPGVDADGEADLVARCATACDAHPRLIALTDFYGECGALIEAVRTAWMDYADVCDGQPEALEDTVPLARVNDFGATARLSYIQTPANAMEARTMGGALAGESAGSGLYDVLELLGVSVPDLVVAGPSGAISMLAFARLRGWALEQTGNAAGEVAFEWLIGVATDDGYRVQATGFPNGDPANPAVEALAVDLSGGRVRTTARGPLTVALTPAGLTLAFRLESADVRGLLSVANFGFDVDRGRLQGYLTDAALAAMVETLYDGCEGDQPSPFCVYLRRIAPTRVAGLGLIKAWVNFDVLYADGLALPCRDDCNATGVCFAIEMSGRPVLGVAD